MSLNTAHINNGVLIYAGECILLFSDAVTLEWSGQNADAFNGSKHGRIYLTTHRVIFNNNKQNDPMASFSFPFVTLSEVDIEQPVFGANYVKGKVRAQPNGNWMGEAKFKMTFKHGGAIEFGQALLKAAYFATQGYSDSTPPPPYTPAGTDQWYTPPPAAYYPPPQGYYGWIPPTNVFPTPPPADGVFMAQAPPPYPGLNTGMGGSYSGAAPPVYGNNNTPSTAYAGVPGYGYPATTTPSTGASTGYGYNGGATGYGYTIVGNGIHGPPLGGAPFPNSKESEAGTSAYYDPNRPQMAYVPPPAYYEQPPAYNDPHKKYQ